MLEARSIQAQLAEAREDRPRVLVVGAGVAGVTVAQLLRGQGLHPVLVERSAREAGSGYMLALMPLVDPVLEALGVREAYLAGSVGLDRYRFRNRAGTRLGEYSLAGLLERFGDYRGISRGELLAVLGSGGGAVTYGATVTALRQRPAAVAAILEDGSDAHEAEFDLVVAADGLHSATRGLVLRPDQVATYDSGWGGWVAWAEPDADVDLADELWGAGVFVGTYPVKGRVGVIVAGPRSDTAAGTERFVDRVRRRSGSVGSRIDRALDVVARHPDAYYWSLTDCRSDAWSVGRVVLVGDAAAGFLPTAGIGAAVAMESAWVLAGLLDAAAPDRVLDVLGRYEEAQRPRVEAAQANSRQLARLMFLRSPALSGLRNTVARFVPLGTALRPIVELLRHQPRPTGAELPVA
jgi:2-polyprenyl-6-methoxyphenol hydroxylase-like FAD-dependent oxidoreductase